MTDVEFGDRYTDLLCGHTETSESLLERAAMIKAVNPDRMVAAYAAYKRRIGAGVTQNINEIRPLLTAAGERDGAGTLAAMQKAFPEFHEISSLVHGWAMNDPAAAVVWFNGLDPDAHEFDRAITGLMWGLSQKSPGMARTVFHSLDHADQLASAEGIGRSLLTSRGPDAVDQLLEGLPPDVASRCIGGAVRMTKIRPPSEIVPWVASHFSTIPEVQGTLLASWHRWLASDPAAAQAWRETAAAANPSLETILPVESP